MGGVDPRQGAEGASRRLLWLLALFGASLLLVAVPQSSWGGQAALTQEETRDYLTRNIHEIQKRLRDYNEAQGVLSTSRGGWKVTLQDWRLERIERGRVFVEIDYKVGSVAKYQRPGTFLFELAWVGGELHFKRHW